VGEYRCEQVGMGADRNEEGRGGGVSKRYDKKVDRKRTFWMRKTVMRQRASRGWGIRHQQVWGDEIDGRSVAREGKE
jgi:hypothetical protein